MPGTRVPFLLSMAVAASLSFNLDTDRPTTFHRDSAGFGHTVAQYANSWVIVGDPLEIRGTNQTGNLYKCEHTTGVCTPIQLTVPPEAVNMSLGLSLVATTRPSRLLACGPTVHQACRENLNLKGFCFLFTAPSLTAQQLPQTLQECPKQEQDIVLLIDGSGSIEQNDFAKMLSFVQNVMSQFPRPTTQFALVQFSSGYRTHFTFSEFSRSSDPLGLLSSVRQLTGYTYTASAIRFVTNEIFSPLRGARTDASKILIVITDGEKFMDPLDYQNVIPQAKNKGIIRYAVGVGSAFIKETSWKELVAIASAPANEHIFRVENFDALRDIQNKLKEKIFAIEGTQTGNSSSFEFEMSQEGFSAVLTPDGPVLGAVGSFSWSGGAFLYPTKMPPTFINMSQANGDMKDSYLGYSTELAFRKGVQSLVLGAPRHKHVGKVVLFTPSLGQWRLKAEVTGTQIGSYFGASLCSVDVDGDRNSDLVLIGAPHYYEQTRGGQVSVCPLPRGRAGWHCEVAVLRGVQGHPWARFGAALTVLGDVNGDQLSDVAVGAPGEQENQGAVYLFHGTSSLGISPTHSQRVAASQLSSRLQHFGQALSGGQDLTGDGLLDLAVGAREHALLFRTRPVLSVEVNIRFLPAEIPRSVFECGEQAASKQELSQATICLKIFQRPQTLNGDLLSTVTFDLTLDPGRLSPRAIFKETNTWNLTRVQVLGLRYHCEEVKLLLPACVEDAVTPITLRLHFSLVGNANPSIGNLQPMLAVDAQRYFTASLPFEKNCGADHVCQDNLGISLGFPDIDTLLVGSDLELAMQVAVWNNGEDSYGTSVTFSYPAGLSYRRVTGGQNHPRFRSLRLTCDSTPGGTRGLRTTRCSAGHVILREGSRIIFTVTFDVSPKATLGDQLLLVASVSSENNTPKTSNSTFQLQLPVKYAVYTVISSHEQSTKYLNFTASGKEKSHEAQLRFQVNNLGHRDLDVNISFWVPESLAGEDVWTGLQVFHPQKPSIQCTSEKTKPTEVNFQARMKKNPVLDCTLAHCQRFRCAVPSFGLQEELDFTLKGNLSFSWTRQTQQKKVVVLSAAEILFDTSVYSQLPGQEAFLGTQVETVLEELEVHDPAPLVVGSSVGGLLLLGLITAALRRLGFFKRQYKEMMEEANEQAAAESTKSDPEADQ
ncbi:integrin alpha-X [Erinaceus europaeus]|uniref:Integrin alpha-X n=1 Tax=Erinaceus europaeus TaxID=9365 RepID=A0ABM3VXP4_ERIEU|nr:integrin alpha-X [Erinaceus europaeus]